MSESKTIDTWAIVELMGRHITAGRVTEEAHFGVVMMRLDIPATDKTQATTQFIGGASIYRVTPCDEESALRWLRFAPLPQMSLIRAVASDDADEEFLARDYAESLEDEQER